MNQLYSSPWLYLSAKTPLKLRKQREGTYQYCYFKTRNPIGLNSHPRSKSNRFGGASFPDAIYDNFKPTDLLVHDKNMFLSLTTLGHYGFNCMSRSTNLITC